MSFDKNWGGDEIVTGKIQPLSTFVPDKLLMALNIALPFSAITGKSLIERRNRKRIRCVNWTLWADTFSIRGGKPNVGNEVV